jgi:tetratricopeptide (TPR) repeat protein
MISTGRYLILSVLISFNWVSVQKLQAQNFEETVSFADNQLYSGNLTGAIKTFQRALFFSDGRNTLYIFRKIAEISYLNNDYETAQKYYGLAYNQADNDSLKTEFLFSKAGCQILDKNYQYALIDLFSVDDSSLYTQKRLNFYLGTCYFGLEDFTKAEEYFILSVEPDERNQVSELFSKKNLLLPSPKKARIFSMIIPGSGQIYAGNLKAGINSLALTSGLIVLAINIGIKYKPVDALFSVFPWYERYYTGGLGKAEEIAINKRQARRSSVYNKILTLASKNHEN